MYKIGEVCKIAGVTRGALRQFEGYGLVSPTSKDKKGRWLYDKDALKKVFLIRILIEVGYKPKNIKCILDSSATEHTGEFDKIVGLLEDKKKHIDEMIVTIRDIQQQILFSDITPEHMANLAPEQRIETRNTLAAVRDTISIPEE